MIVSCDCGAKLKIDEAKIAGRKVKVRCPRCGNVLPLQQAQPAAPAAAQDRRTPLPSSATPLVLIAHDSDVVGVRWHTDTAHRVCKKTHADRAHFGALSTKFETRVHLDQAATIVSV